MAFNCSRGFNGDQAEDGLVDTHGRNPEFAFPSTQGTSWAQLNMSLTPELGMRVEMGGFLQHIAQLA